MSADPSKTLTIKKPLSLAKHAQIAAALGTATLAPPDPEVSTSPPLSSQEASSNQPNPKASPPSLPDPDALQALEKQRQARAHQALLWLCHTYPACFDLQDPQPLKIGILKDLFSPVTPPPTADQPSHNSLRRALSQYTRRRRYHQALLNAAHRYDLTGHPCDDLTPEQRAHAQAQLETKDQVKQQKQRKKTHKHKKKSKQTWSNISKKPPIPTQTETPG